MKTINEIIQIVENKNMKFVEMIEYKGAKSIIKVICPNNHEPYIVNLSTITRNNRASLGCPTCKKINKSITNINKVSFEYIQDYFKDYGYSIITTKKEYSGISIPLNVICPNGHNFKISFEEFKRRKDNGKTTINKCEFCYKEQKMLALKEKCDKLNYTLLTKEYVNKNMLLNIICDKGHLWTPTYENFMRNNAKCLTCNNIMLSETQRKPIEDVNAILNSYGYTLLSDYYNNNAKLKLMCPNGHIYYSTLANFMAGKRCSICSMSSGEQEIYRVLNKYNISFIFQYVFDDCCDIRPLPFDFYLDNYNVCIEFDGQQHYIESSFNKTKKEFEDRQYKDNIKTTYCKNNNIKLIRIPYWDFDNIESIIKKELNLT